MKNAKSVWDKLDEMLSSLPSRDDPDPNAFTVDEFATRTKRSRRVAADLLNELVTRGKMSKKQHVVKGHVRNYYTLV